MELFSIRIQRTFQLVSTLFTAIFCAVPVKQIADNNIIIIIFRILFIYLSNYVRISTKYIFYNSNRFIRPIYFLSIIITF